MRHNAKGTKVGYIIKFINGIEMPREKIRIILPDGKEKEGTSFETTALDIAK